MNSFIELSGLDKSKGFLKSSSSPRKQADDNSNKNNEEDKGSNNVDNNNNNNDDVRKSVGSPSPNPVGSPDPALAGGSETTDRTADNNDRGADSSLDMPTSLGC